MQEARRIIKKYSENFKLQVIKEYEEGSYSLGEISRKYGITGNRTLYCWLKKYGKNHMVSKVVRIETQTETGLIEELLKKLKESEQKNTELSKVIAETIIEKKVMGIYIKKLEEAMEQEVKKKADKKR